MAIRNKNDKEIYIEDRFKIDLEGNENKMEIHQQIDYNKINSKFFHLFVPNKHIICFMSFGNFFLIYKSYKTKNLNYQKAALIFTLLTYLGNVYINF
jgi:hypothetical protein